MNDKHEAIDKKTIWQDNFITSARYEMSSLEKNILYCVLSQVKANTPKDYIYKVSAKDIGRNGENLNYENIRKATEKLLSRVLEGRLPNGNMLQVNFISHAEYLTNQGVIQIGISPMMLPFLIDLKANFTTFDLETALSLKSIYSKRIYELLSMYKNFDNKTFVRDVKDFKRSLDIINAKTGKDKYETFSLLKKNVLDVALNEINSSTDINFSYVPIAGSKQGKGRKPIEKLEFTVKSLVPRKTVSYDKVEAMPLLNRLINDYKLRQDQAAQVLNTFSFAEINKELYDIQLEVLSKKVRGNLGAYTAVRFKLSIK